MPINIKIPDRLDHDGARQVHAILSNEVGKSINLDCSAITFVGGLAMQVLLSAAAQWRCDGVPFTFERPSLAFTDDLARLGVNASDFMEEALPCR